MLTEQIYSKFRNSLPSKITDNTVKAIVAESIDRSNTILREDPSFLLGDDVKITVSKFWNGDIEISQGGQFGINWVFDSKTGVLHTT